MFVNHNFVLSKNMFRTIIIFVIFINQMFGPSQKSVEQKLLKDANFLSVYVYVYKCMYVLICFHASGGRCAKTTRSSYWSWETENKLCGSCILTTKRVIQTNYYDIITIGVLKLIRKCHVITSYSLPFFESHVLLKWLPTIEIQRMSYKNVLVTKCLPWINNAWQGPPAKYSN